MRKGLNRNLLKYIAIIAMVLDHVAFLFIPPFSLSYQICRFIGKLTAPIMCYFLAEGYNYTSSKIKYGTRLLIFAIISQFAFSLAFYNTLFTLKFNMIFTLFLSFLILLGYEKIPNKFLKWTVISFAIIISYFSDWGIFAPIWVLCFYIFKDNKLKQSISYYIATILVIIIKYVIIKNYGMSVIVVQLGLFLFIPVLYLYNGEKGKSSRFNKWFFYIFYPLHMILLYIV